MILKYCIKGLICVSLITSFYACSEDVPSDLLAPDRFRNVLIQLHILEGKMIVLNPTTDVAYKIFGHEAQQVFKLNATDSATFYRTYHYYAEHPKLLDAIYAEVVDSLSLKEGLLEQK
jgi:hypothetical protein